MMGSMEYEQPALELSITGREVRAYRAETIRQRRAFFFGKDVTRIVSLEALVFKADELDLDHVSDPDLLYALRFADAAQSAGWTSNDRVTYSRHQVHVLATDTDEKSSELISADYSGVIDENGNDTFMENLHRFDPSRQSIENS